MQNIITELVCTRLSHDIIGNIGAVANAVELLEEGDVDFMDDIKSILKTSSTTLAARLKFFRMAFGLNNANLEDEITVKNIAQDYLFTLGNKDFPINLQFDVPLARNRKNALLMIMVIADILIRGGNIKAYCNENSLIVDIDASLKISTDKLTKIKDALYASSCNQDASLAPLACLLDQENKLSLIVNDSHIKLVMENI